ncbi:MAG: hypothetical protein N2512_09350 [Armatimonadetes bacterium]|nr:hypothetical protein [Armatimonadota bacterium]
MTGWRQRISEGLQRMVTWIRRGSEAAGEWLDEKTAITSRLRTIRRLRADQQRLLNTIGAKVYTLHTRGKVRNRDVLADCQRIDEILAQIERLRKEIEEIKRRSTRPEIQLMAVEDEEPLVQAEEEAAEVEVTEGSRESGQATPAKPAQAEAPERQMEQTPQDVGSSDDTLEPGQESQHPHSEGQ